MRGALLLGVLCTACGELGLSLDVSAKADVPPLDYLRVEVLQDQVLVEQTFKLGTTTLPQSIAIVSKGMTRGTVEVTVQGLAAGRVEAIAHGTGSLEPATKGSRVAMVLERLFAPGMSCGCAPRECSTSAPRSCGLTGDGCGGKRGCGGCASGETCGGGFCRSTACAPKTCADLGANCGLTLDGCGHTIECGNCDAGLNCGGGSGPNVCGPGNCTRRNQCDAGLECGSVSDNCGGLVSCGNCPMQGVCGSDLKCPCVPSTTCPNGKQCGQWTDGCNGMVSCGACTLPETCSANNQCGCTRNLTCDPLQCGTQPDGCGGTHLCANPCGPGRTCGPAPDGGMFDRCNCAPGITECNGACVSLMTDEQNCGACGRSCPGGQTCTGGLCPCVDAGSNADGHCCPPGWFLAPHLEFQADLRCFKGPFDAGTEAEGLLQCLFETDAGFARAVSALGNAIGRNSAAAVPLAACGSFLRGRNDQVLDAESGNLTQQAICSSACTFSSCVCTTCTCSAATGRSCAQKYFCVMDPLGPKVSGSCSNAGDCPPGMTCSTGNCVDAGKPFCVLDSDCGSVGANNCIERGSNSSTGLCQ